MGKINRIAFAIQNLDGTGVSERYASQLASNTVVFKVYSPFYNYYSRFFKPWIHYIPVEYDLSDLIQKIEWANENPREAYAIMKRANNLSKELFQPQEVICYTNIALSLYSLLMGYEVEQRNDMTEFMV